MTLVVAAGLTLSATGDPRSPADPAAASADAGTRLHAAAVADVIVTGRAGQEAAAERAILALGGRVTRRLGVIHGFAAQVPASAVPRLASSPSVVSVTPDRPLTAAAPATTTPAARSAAVRSTAASTTGATTDTGAMGAVTQLVGATSAWSGGTTGQGVDVALIDTGVAPVPGLDANGKVLVGPDLSLDAPDAPTPGLDAYGHGTFMAGIIAGQDAGTTPGAPGAFTGVAPGSRIVNVKVGASDGAADVSQVIAAIDWVTQHAHDPGLNIRVLNLSFGTDGSQDYGVDPLAQAAEQAWKHGIVVVAAAGNDGKATKPLGDPALDPYLIAVGADDPNGTLDVSDDSVPTWAQHGTNARPVDVIAPAAHVLSLRVPGSYVDTMPTNTGQVGTRFQRGSGTSEAAAVVSGLAALIVQQYPAATPDQVKALLCGTATPVLRGSGKPTAPGQRLYSGYGLANVAAALATGPSASAAQTWPAATGTGTLDGARGSSFVADNGADLTGQQDIFGHPFDSAAMAAQQASASSWSGGVWNGSHWTGDGWTGSHWTTTNWTGTDWAGSHWTGTLWTTMTWTGSHWTGGGWSGSHWTGSHWTGSHWTGDRWSTAAWD